MLISTTKKSNLTNMPQGVWALCFIQVVSTLSFSVLYSTLVLYMRGKLGLPTYTANSIMGVFVAFNFALHLLGGYWGGRWFSYRTLFCIGMVAQIIGCIMLSFSTQAVLYYGLAFFLTGSGLNVTCLNCMLTQRFSPQDTRRETAFLWNYAGMNVGFFMGFSLSGYFQLTQDYRTLFLLSSLGNAMALFLCFWHWKGLRDIETIYVKKSIQAQKQASRWTLLLICLLPVLLSQMLHHAEWSNKLVLVTGVLMLAVVCYLAFQQDTKSARDKMLAFAILMLISVVFWMLYQIGPMGLTNFIDRNVQRSFSDWIIPPQWFQNINTIAIVIGGPLLGMLFTKMRAKGIGVNIPTQFALALFLIGLAFVILPIGIARANPAGLVHPGWVVLSFILQSVGELLISPIGYAMIGALAPSSLQGVMMGIWMLTTGVGATLSSYSSNWMTAGQESLIPLATNSGYSHVFLMLGIFAIAGSLVLFLLIPILRSLMQTQLKKSLKEENLVMV